MLGPRFCHAFRVSAGQSYPLYARFEGENWTADDYAAYGILPERGREFVMRFNFFVGACHVAS